MWYLLKLANWGKRKDPHLPPYCGSITDGLQNSVYKRKPSEPRKEDQLNNYLLSGEDTRKGEQSCLRKKRKLLFIKKIIKKFKISGATGKNTCQKHVSTLMTRIKGKGRWEGAWMGLSWKVKSKPIDPTNIYGDTLLVKHCSGLGMQLAFQGVRVTLNKPMNECHIIPDKQVIGRKTRLDKEARGERCYFR